MQWAKNVEAFRDGMRNSFSKQTIGQYGEYQDKLPSDATSSVRRFTISLRTVRNRAEIVPASACFLHFVKFTQLSTRCHLSLPTDSQEPIALNIQPCFRCFFEGHDPPLMHAGPDAQHILDPSSVSVCHCHYVIRHLTFS